MEEGGGGGGGKKGGRGRGEGIEGDEFILYPVRLERWLMEGSFDRVWQATKREGVPSEEFGAFSQVSLSEVPLLSSLMEDPTSQDFLWTFKRKPRGRLTCFSSPIRRSSARSAMRLLRALKKRTRRCR